MSTLFGTDGVRGRPGEPPLDRVTLARLGAAVARAVRPDDRPASVLIGRDTRESGVWITGELARGLVFEGARVADAGVLPTPAVACLARDGDYDAGLVVSASHNPYQDNGVKVIIGSGEKADEALESTITDRVRDERWQVPGGPAPSLTAIPGEPAYLDHLVRVFEPTSVPVGFGVALDCANGATSRVGPAVYRRLGFDPVVIHDRPDGRNINLACGSTHPDALVRTVVDRGCRFGAAFDGDGDRVVFVDHAGALVDGDAILLIAARRLAGAGRLPGRAIVATVMSNLGLEQVLAGDGVTVHRCPVGDRSVWVEMRRRGATLGGEQSGHIIFSDLLPTGDGLATSLLIARAVIETGRDLADLAADLVPLPQVLVNARVGRRVPLDDLPGVLARIADAERTLGREGRVLVRYSGTEALLRVMVEGRDRGTIEGLAGAIADQARAEIGES